MHGSGPSPIPISSGKTPRFRRLPVHARDYTLLASQPLSVAGLEDAARDAIVISAVRRGDEPIIISLYGDDLWELWPYFEQSNVQRCEKRIDWSTMRPSFVPGTKAILYRYWVAGTPGLVRPVARSIRSYFYSRQVFVKWLEKMAIRRFAEIRPLHIAAFVEDCRARGVTLKGQVILYRAIELLYALRRHSPDALMQHPWRDSTAARMSGLHGPASIWVAQTPVIPDDVLRRLFQYAETRLNNAGRILDERDRGNRHPCRDPDLLQLRNACAFLIGILSGMRCD